MNGVITADNVAHSCMTGLRKSIGMFVQHAHYEVRIVKKFCFINKSHIYGRLILSGKYGCNTWLGFVLMRWKKSSSADLNRSAMDGRSLLQ